MAPAGAGFGSASRSSPSASPIAAPAAVTRAAAARAAVALVTWYHSTRDRKMATRHCNACRGGEGGEGGYYTMSFRPVNVCQHA